MAFEQMYSAKCDWCGTVDPYIAYSMKSAIDWAVEKDGWAANKNVALCPTCLEVGHTIDEVSWDIAYHALTGD